MTRILHLGTITLNLNKQVYVRETDLNKPNFGSNVLWGSTMIKTQNGNIWSSWKNFTFFDCYSKDHTYGVSFTLHRKAKILTIASFEDYKKAMEKYKCVSYHKDRYCLDFAKIAKDYDAFHLTEDAFYDMRLPFGNYIAEEMRKLRYEDFYAYDAESWIIFNYNAINKGSILSHNSACNPYKRDYDDYED